MSDKTAGARAGAHTGAHALKQERYTRVFSGVLFGRDVKSQALLVVAILAVMMLMCAVLSVAAHTVAADKTGEISEDTQEEFFTYLAGMAAYNSTAAAVTGVELSCDDFLSNDDHAIYETAFNLINTRLSLDEELSVEGFAATLSAMQDSGIALDVYVSEFEYAYALAQTQGVFSGDDLDMQGMLGTMLSVMGVSDTIVEGLSEMDTTSLLNTMYYKITGLLPILLLVVLLSNNMFASQVDKGSMAYLLSTPITRKATAITQAVYMLVVPLVLVVVVCLEKIAVMTYLEGSANVEMIVVLYVGWYLLAEAMAGICYFGSCLFNTSGRSLAFGGGLAVWFFIASFLAVFGGDDLVNMGVGVEELGMFDYVTITGLFDTTAIGTIGSGSVDLAFLIGFGVLGALALVFYVAGAVCFCRKDLPL